MTARTSILFGAHMVTKYVSVFQVYLIRPIVYNREIKCNVLIYLKASSHNTKSYKSFVLEEYASCDVEYVNTVKPVYNDHLMGYISAFWSSSRWPRAT